MSTSNISHAVLVRAHRHWDKSCECKALWQSIPRQTLLRGTCIRVAFVLGFVAYLSLMFGIGCANCHAHEYDAKRTLARRWIPELPAAEEPLPPETQQEFEQAWTLAGAAASKVVVAWDRAIKDDPLLGRALEGFRRSQDELSPQYNAAREEIRQQLGNKTFQELERKYARWPEVQPMPWLDNTDENLIRLCIWYIKASASSDRRSQEPFAALLANDAVPLTEAQTIEVFKAAVQKTRDQFLEQRQALEASLTAMPRMREYLEIRDESDSVRTFCEMYLRMQRPDYVLSAEDEFSQLFRKAQEIRPDLLGAIARAHPDEFPQPPFFLLEWSVRTWAIAMNVVLVVVLATVISVRLWRRRPRFSGG